MNLPPLVNYMREEYACPLRLSTLDIAPIESYPRHIGEIMGRSENLLGTLELLVLKTLARGPNHGFGITLHVETVSEGLLRMEEGSLYPALHRLEKDKLVKTPGGKPRMPAGRGFTP